MFSNGVYIYVYQLYVKTVIKRVNNSCLTLSINDLLMYIYVIYTNHIYDTKLICQ